jgi:hypothetical protein
LSREVKSVVDAIAPIQGPGLVSLVDAYLRLAPAAGNPSSTVMVSRVFEWRADGVPAVRSSPLLPVKNLLIYGNGVQRLSSASAGVAKASPKE